MEKLACDGIKWGQEYFFLLIQTLPTFWAQRIWFLILFIFCFFRSQNFEFPGPQISKFLDFQVPRSPDSQNPRFPDFQVPRFPDAADGGGCGRTLRSQPDPSPNAPRDRIRRKGPCCDVMGILTSPDNNSPKNELSAWIIPRNENLQNEDPFCLKR